MPAVPEVFNVSADKRLIKVFRRFDTHNVADTDGKHRVTRKIKKQVQAVSVHVQHITPQFAVGDMRQIHNEVRVNRISDNEFVQETDKNFMNAGIQ